MNTAARQKRATSEVITESVRARTQTKQVEQVDEKFADIESNPFYEIAFDPTTNDNEKKKEFAKALTFDKEESKEKVRERLKEFLLFAEYLSSVREEMANEIIRLTDTETFSELQKVYGELNRDLQLFDEAMAPLTNTLDALYRLRTGGRIYDTYVEIQEDRRKEKELNEQEEKIKDEISGIRSEIDNITYDVIGLQQDRSWFGVGGIKKESSIKIAQHENRLAELNQILAANESKTIEIQTQREQLKQRAGEFDADKEELRKLLDISSEEHIQRQKSLVNSALQFVNTAKTRVGSVREHLGRMNNQVENLFDSNTSMTTLYAVMNEGIKEASEVNLGLSNELGAAPESEDKLAEVTRRNRKMDVDAYVKTLDDAARDTLTTYADLSSQSVRIKSMKDANDAQIDKARTLHTQGIAGVADRLSVVLQAVSSAALNESHAMAKDTIVQMVDNTNVVAQKEVIKNATGVDEINKDLQKAIDDLGAYGEVVNTATKITREGVAEMRENLENLRKMAAETVDLVQDSISINADSANDAKPVKLDSKREKSTKASSSFNNPFKK